LIRGGMRRANIDASNYQSKTKRLLFPGGNQGAS
jgi:hypothetical protein